jgi:hypothetical protein
MATRNAPDVIYGLRCKHAVSAPSTLVNGKLYCPWHETLSTIEEVIIYEWRAKCDNCIYARWAGLDKGTAEIFANGHYRRNSTHRVAVEYTINPEAVKTKEKMERFGGH